MFRISPRTGLIESDASLLWVCAEVSTAKVVYNFGTTFNLPAVTRWKHSHVQKRVRLSQCNPVNMLVSGASVGGDYQRFQHTKPP